MAVENRPSVYYMVGTGNRPRALHMQEALGGKSVQIIPQVNEDLVKPAISEPMSVEAAIAAVIAVSRYKVVRDIQRAGGLEGIRRELQHVGKRTDDFDAFRHIARLSGDSMQLYWKPGNREGQVRVYNKPVDNLLYELHNHVSERPTAIVTALTSMVKPIDDKSWSRTENLDMLSQLRTRVAMTEYSLGPVTQPDMVEFIQEIGIANIRTISGGIPFTNNRFVDTTQPYRVSVIDTDGNAEVVLEGNDWNVMNTQKRRDCVYGTFPEVIQPLIAPSGVVYQNYNH